MNMAGQSPLDRPVFLVGSGRCGSTLLQRLLNSSPEFLIWGEHSAILSHLAAAWAAANGHDLAARLKESPDDWASREARLRDPERWIAWDNGINEEGVRTLFRDFVMNFFAGPGLKPVRWGFKEPRYGWTGDLTLPFLHALFPEARTIVLIRNPLDTIRSMLLAWYSDERSSTAEIDAQIFKLAEIWTRLYGNLFLFHHQFPAATMLLRYEDLMLPECRPGLTDFLGAGTPLDWEGILQRKLDQSPGDSDFARRALERMEQHRATLARITCQVRALYGYPTQPAYDSVPYLKTED
jgi:hypothetical protein